LPAHGARNLDDVWSYDAFLPIWSDQLSPTPILNDFSISRLGKALDA
jgi:hypothetical protein